MPATDDLHLVLTVEGAAAMETCTGGRRRQRHWTPGQLDMAVPGVASVRRYRSVVPMRTLQVHIPRVTVARTVEQLGGERVDYERMATAVASGDPLVEHTMRSLGAACETDDLYAESAAAFLAVHVLTCGVRGCPSVRSPRGANSAAPAHCPRRSCDTRAYGRRRIAIADPRTAIARIHVAPGRF
ncbi:hypothetical protein [Streptomyces iranensis]|uniref:Transcriptional regulator, AraC family n=1 Tax=Streptomyces iranensis TaxID=576784 RepID=A0A061A0U5_9ACTN|nr:hypothetical protein [Streptomyces iranensis]CDR14697.1 transcriptional regulator, AraC family [Streptomyces iranensis]